MVVFFVADRPAGGLWVFIPTGGFTARSPAAGVGVRWPVNRGIVAGQGLLTLLFNAALASVCRALIYIYMVHLIQFRLWVDACTSVSITTCDGYRGK